MTQRKRTVHKCPFCGMEFMGYSKKNIKGCPNYECGERWEEEARRKAREKWWAKKEVMQNNPSNTKTQPNK